MWNLSRPDNGDQRETRLGLFRIVWLRKTRMTGESQLENAPGHAVGLQSRRVLR
jgi:hypothetical protein